MSIKSTHQSILQMGWHHLRIFLLLICLAILLNGAVVPTAGLTSQVRSIIRPIEFDFGTWTAEAFIAKLSGWGLSLERFLTPEAQSQLVLDYLEQVQQVNVLNAEILAVYTNPEIRSPDLVSQPLRDVYQTELDYLTALAPIAEAVLQTQLMDIIHESSLSVFGQAFPPSLYQVSDIPQSLVISPRDEIRREMDISLLPSISVDYKDELENAIFSNLDRAALVVPIGGIGTYPTMVMQSSNLVWLTEVVAHEWVHNFLTLRPLGINYFSSEDLRTINETTATLAGQELGWLILQKYYPANLPPDALPPHIEASISSPEVTPDPNAFDYQVEMRLTRVETDRLLAAGDIEGAEAYMEVRRQVFWENGFPIRKLNQAYFAFYGAYSAEPGGPAGEDPVGPAVVALRDRYDRLADFLNAISWINSYEGLLSLLNP